MRSLLPEYMPPSHQRASLAVGLAPILVLLGFTLVVTRLVDVSSAFALFSAATVWVVYEMHVYQASIDRYNQDYAARHLVWRSDETLRALLSGSELPEPTRAFVHRFVAAERAVLRDGQMP